MARWNLDSIRWSDLRLEEIDHSLLALAKGASLVESNANDYVIYLRNVFRGDDEILQAIDVWGEEEKIHGEALRRWCELADPEFNFEAAMTKFLASYRVPMQVQESVRGGKAQELVARCIVETGTTVFYIALRDAAQEPVLKEICRRIASDEVQHFNLFLKYLNGRYAQSDDLNWFRRCGTVYQRISEVTDEELSFAYLAANFGRDFNPLPSRKPENLWAKDLLPLYEARHFRISVPMVAKAAGVKLRPWMVAALADIGRGIFQFKCRARE